MFINNCILNSGRTFKYKSNNNFFEFSNVNFTLTVHTIKKLFYCTYLLLIKPSLSITITYITFVLYVLITHHTDL